MSNFFKKHKKIADLVYFEGPLLSLFTSNGDDIYMYKWVDIDNEKHVWLVFRIYFYMLDGYLQGKVSEHQLIHDAAERKLVNIDQHLKFSNEKNISFKEIPQNYLPDEDVFFEKGFTFDNDKIDSFMNSFENKAKIEPQKPTPIAAQATLRNSKRLIS